MARLDKKGKLTKKEIYLSYGIEYDTKAQKILSPIGWIKPLLINGNKKLGKGVYTFSSLPTNRNYTIDINGKKVTVKGTCPCCCKDCYATTGRYVFDNVIQSLGRKTYLSYFYLEFVYRAIMAQIKADKIKICRIHAAGDFFSMEYVRMWKQIIAGNPDCIFWTYTKFSAAEKAFDELENANIVKSIVPGYGFNFGTCKYIIDLYHALKAAGKSVYICRCGIDNNQHCNDCKHCFESEFVLFLKHSDPSYDPKKDPYYSEFVQLVESQSTERAA